MLLQELSSRYYLCSNLRGQQCNHYESALNEWKLRSGAVDLPQNPIFQSEWDKPLYDFFHYCPELPKQTKQKNSCSKMWAIDQLYIKLGPWLSSVLLHCPNAHTRKNVICLHNQVDDLFLAEFSKNFKSNMLDKGLKICIMIYTSFFDLID